MRKLIGSLVILLSFCSASFAVDCSEPSAYLESVSKNLINAVEQNKEALKNDTKLAEKLVREYMLPAIDTEGFSKRTLGSKTWKAMTKLQQETFINGFINQVIGKYAKGLALYDGQAFVFEKAQFNKTKSKARVKSEMKQDGSQPFKIDYELSNIDNQWRIINIMVEGTDMRKSYKNQFLPRINEIGMDKFLLELSDTKSDKKVAS